MSRAECFADQPEPEPEPRNGYLDAVLEKSYALNAALHYTHWRNEAGTSELVLRPRRISGVMRGESFDTYRSLSSDMRHALRSVTEGAMRAAIDVAEDADMRVLLEYVPLLFMPNGRMAFGQREHDGNEIRISSDKLRTPIERHALLGGLATVLYYVDNPTELDNVNFTYPQA